MLSQIDPMKQMAGTLRRPPDLPTVDSLWKCVRLFGSPVLPTVTNVAPRFTTPVLGLVSNLEGSHGYSPPGAYTNSDAGLW